MTELANTQKKEIAVLDNLAMQAGYDFGCGSGSVAALYSGAERL